MPWVVIRVIAEQSGARCLGEKICTIGECLRSNPIFYYERAIPYDNSALSRCIGVVYVSSWMFYGWAI
jgi:hypothetical protein